MMNPVATGTLSLLEFFSLPDGNTHAWLWAAMSSPSRGGHSSARCGQWSERWLHLVKRQTSTTHDATAETIDFPRHRPARRTLVPNRPRQPRHSPHHPDRMFRLDRIPNRQVD